MILIVVHNYYIHMSSLTYSVSHRHNHRHLSHMECCQYNIHQHRQNCCIDNRLCSSCHWDLNHRRRYHRPPRYTHKQALRHSHGWRHRFLLQYHIDHLDCKLLEFWWRVQYEKYGILITFPLSTYILNSNVIIKPAIVRLD